jgi:hypothetical protein
MMPLSHVLAFHFLLVFFGPIYLFLSFVTMYLLNWLLNYSFIAVTKETMEISGVPL